MHHEDAAGRAEDMNVVEDWNEEDDTPGLAFELSHIRPLRRGLRIGIIGF